MWSAVRSCLALTLAVSLLGPTSSALGQAVTGAVVGKVVDSSQSVLPGVTVTLTSTRLVRGTQTVTTETDGSYRLQNLPPGSYVITAELQGFQVVTREVIIEAGRTIATDFQLGVGTLTETVTVSAQAPLVDVRNTRVGTTVDENLIQNIPTGRSFSDLLNIQPGVNESTYTFAPVNSVQGSDVRSNYYAMDGFQMVDTTVGYFIGDIDYDSLQEVQITTGGISAEFGQASGGVFNFITKSGGNTVKGGARMYINDSSLNSSNVTDDLRQRGVRQAASIKKRNNWSLDLGGPIKRNKVWFYGNFARTDKKESVPALAGVVDPVYNGWILFGKLTWQAAEHHQIQASHQGRHDNWIPANADAASRADPGSWIYNTRNQENYLVKWSGTLGSKLLMEVRYSENRGGGSDKESYPNADPKRAGYIDSGNGLTYGWWRSDRWNVQRDAKVFKSDLTYYAAGPGGSHDLKVGFEQERDPFRNILHYPESMQQFLLNGVPNQVILHNEPINQARNVTRYSFYVQDQWTTKKDVTINAGLRFDRSEGWTPDQSFGKSERDYPVGQWFPPITFEPKRNIVTPQGLAPRLGVTWDVAGKHKVVVKANYGRWYDRLINVPSAQGGSQTWEWIDRNGDRRFQSDERGTLISSSVLSNPVWVPSQFVDPDRKNPHTDSFQLAMEWEVLQGVALAVTGTYKVDKEHIGSLSREVPYSAYNAIQATNPLNGQPITIFALKPEFRTVTRVAWSTTLEELERDYKGLGIVLKRRFDGRYQYQLSADVGRNEGNVGTSVLKNTNFVNPNSLINAFGPTDLDAALVFKAQGTYKLPWEIMVSGLFLYNSGFPLDIANTSGAAGARVARFFRADYPQMVVEPFIDVPIEPRGSERQDAQYLTSVRFEKKFKVRKGQLGLIADVFNAFNTVSVINVQSLRLDAPNFLMPEAITQPRTARFGIRYEF